MAFELPLANSEAPTAERADAARNRERILAAAVGLIERHGIEAITVQDVAAAAGVGAGTLYRRFGDREGLALALLDEEAREFQDAIISGAPPLGPGAPPRERLVAFGEGYLDLLGRRGDLVAAAGGPRLGGRGPYGFHATHLALLVRGAAPALDPEFTAHALLGALAPGLHLHLHRELDWPEERLRAGWRALVNALAS